jgi:hypothetical protein
MNKPKIVWFIILVMLLFVLTYINYQVKNQIAALIYNIGLLLAFWTFQIISNGFKQIKTNRIFKGSNRSNAKIISIEKYKNNLVFQLNISTEKGPYICSYVHCIQTNAGFEEYRPGDNFSVYINPKDPYDLHVLVPKKKKQPSERNYGGLIWTFIVMGFIGLPFIIDLFDTSDRMLKNTEHIAENNHAGQIWEIKFKSPKKLFIKVDDPYTNKTVKSIKYKSDSDIDYYTNFSIYKQKINVLIIGYNSSTPVFDVINSTTFEKVSGISELERTYKELESGIVRIEKMSLNKKFFNDEIFEFTTTDGLICFYNVQKDLFFNNEKALKKYIDDTDEENFLQNLFAFALSTVEGSDYQKQLYGISSTSEKYYSKLYGLAGTYNFDLISFNKSKRYNCKKCEATLLSEEKFLESKIVYFDTELVVVISKVSMKKDTDEKIAAFDSSGKKLFEIQSIDFPNVKSMKENNYNIGSTGKFKCSKSGNQIIFNFSEFGILCFDLVTGKQVWKHET